MARELAIESHQRELVDASRVGGLSQELVIESRQRELVDASGVGGLSQEWR